MPHLQRQFLVTAGILHLTYAPKKQCIPQVQTLALKYATNFDSQNTYEESLAGFTRSVGQIALCLCKYFLVFIVAPQPSQENGRASEWTAE